jgi:hypothetical protein
MPTTPNLRLQELATGDQPDAIVWNKNFLLLDTALSSGANLRAISIDIAGDIALGAVADTGITVTFTTSTAGQNVEARFHGVFAKNVGGAGFAGSASMYINLDAGATEYTFTPWNEINGSGGDDSFNANASCGCVFLGLSAGSHTIKMRASGTNTKLLANATTPATLIVEYQ